MEKKGDVLQARWGTHGDHAIATLTASSLQDVFLMTASLSRRQTSCGYSI